ncbi:MAG: flagellar protein FlaG [Bacillota bacterium]
MRIESMDAANLPVRKVQDTTYSPNSVNSANSDNSPKTDTKENKNIPLSQIPDYERRELSISDKAVINAIEKANKAITGANRQFEFSIHEKTKEIMVKVIDTNTREVIREIPPEKILDMVAKMWEMAGIMVDERG